MSRTYHHGERRIRVRGVKKDPPDLRRMARALIALAQAETEAQADAEVRKQTARGNRSKCADNSGSDSESPKHAARPEDGDAA